MSAENHEDFADQSDPVSFNQAAWDQLAGSGDRYYHTVTTQQIAAARNGNWKIRITPQKPVPRDWLEPLAGRQVLCLAGGGGLQAPLLAAAGALVTVFDVSEQQLARDRLIAERENLEIETVVGDMSDLRCFPDQQFELIVNPCSVCYCPMVTPIWAECSRVLKTGGTRPREYGHTLTDLIGKQLSVGLVLSGLYEDGWALNDKLSSYVDVSGLTVRHSVDRCLKQPMG